MDRRRLLAGAAALVAAGCTPASRGGRVVEDRATSIAEENTRPGSARWQSPELGAYLHATSSPVATDALAIYTSRASVVAGDELALHASGRWPLVDVEVYRLGWYGGTGGRLLWSSPNRRVRSHHGVAPDDHGAVRAGWPVVASLQVPPSWRSGVYLVVARPTGLAAPVRYAPFVVRDPFDAAPILVQVPLATYQAYNAWGGRSLYEFNSPLGRAPAVSFDRPYDVFGGAGFLFYGDLQLVRWLERRGDDVSYATSVDVATEPALMDGRRLFVSAFHDEYWSTLMRSNLEGWIERGASALFLSANNVYWRTRMPDTRTIVCFKEDAQGPPVDPDRSEVTATWRSTLVGRPEHRLLGVAYGSYRFPYGTGGPWRVRNADHWWYEGTGLRDGDELAGLVGYEWDAVPEPGRAGLTMLSDSEMGDGTRHQAAVVEVAGRGTVVSCSTTYLPRVLTGGGGFRRDGRVERMVANALARLAGC